MTGKWARALLKSALRVSIVSLVLSSPILVYLAWLLVPQAEYALHSGYRTVRSAFLEHEIFTIRTIVVRGTDIIPADSILARTRDRMPRTIWGSLARVKKVIANTPGIAAYRIDRQLPSTVIISIIEAPVVAWVDRNERLAITKSGDIVQVSENHVDRMARLPSIRPPRRITPGIVRALHAAHALQGSRMRWTADIVEIHPLPSGDLKLFLEPDKSVSVVVPGDTSLPFTTRLVDAVLHDVRDRFGNEQIEADLRFADQIVVRLGSARS